MRQRRRTTMRYDRARTTLDRRPNYILGLHGFKNLTGERFCR